MTLKLGVNETYRTGLEMAQQLTGIEASALAAVIDAEAAKINSGASKGMWDKSSFNEGSGAAGLTQFLANTWVGHAQIPGHLLNSRGKEAGLVNSSNKVVSSKKDDLLKLRFDPTLSIVSAAEYGSDNLKILAHASVLPADLTDDKRARFIYLAHHEGAGGATGFLRGTKIYTRANLLLQVGANTADKYINKCGGDASAAYRMWLNDYIDEKIVPSKFRDTGSVAVATSVTVHAGSAISLGGEALPTGRAYVTTEGLNFRKSPDGQIIRSLTLGDPVTIAGRIGDTRWYDVDVAGTTGVVSGAYLRPPIAAPKEALFAKVIAEWTRFNKGHSSEEDQPYDGYVHEMWQAIALNYWGHSTYPDGRDVPWSAAFVSWVVRKGGAKYAAFKFNASHSVFSNDAIRARVVEQENKPYWAYRIQEQRPEIGDIIHRNRSGGTFSYEYAENHANFESHSDVVVEVRGLVARVIGGNTGPGQGTVYMHEYDLDSSVFLKTGQLIIAILKNRANQVP
ncbi:DUF2272 domain-containing protein [Mesorhizobium sp. M0046]|uniref:DUF2272 domain-containing protein n=1 Tax=Mesorhizobium sp. M0046 TaxID=2956858 RepID=UPI00333942AE